MKLVNLILMTIAFSFLFIGAEIADSDEILQIDRDIYNYTESTIILPEYNISEIYGSYENTGELNKLRFYKVLEKGMNFLLFTMQESSKVGIEYGYTNPNINWELLMKYTLYILIAILILLLIKPLGYAAVFIIMLIIMIKDKVNKKQLNKNGRRKLI